MKLILTEAQLRVLPLNEGMEDSTLFKVYEKTYKEAKEKLNGLYLKIISYNVKEILDGDNEIDMIETIAYDYYNKVSKMAGILSDKVDSLPEEVFDRDSDRYENFRDMVSNYENIIWKKHSTISDIVYSLQSLYGKVIEEENVDINKLFSDIKTIDI